MQSVKLKKQNEDTQKIPVSTDAKTTEIRTYHDGPNGGCYYFQGNKKKYVAHSYCGR